jgi:hypothetical protein
MLGPTKDGCKAQITNFDLSNMAIDEDIVAFEVSVYDRRIMAVHISKTTQDLAGPALDCSNIYSLIFLPVPACILYHVPL